jgi:hypothetical protein
MTYADVKDKVGNQPTVIAIMSENHARWYGKAAPSPNALSVASNRYYVFTMRSMRTCPTRTNALCATL